MFNYRSCPEDREETLAAKMEEYEAPRLLHLEANKLSQAKVSFVFFLCSTLSSMKDKVDWKLIRHATNARTNN